MADTVFCRSCGEPVPADSRYCEHCGVKLEHDVSRRRPLISNLLARVYSPERVETLAPGSSEFVSQVSEQLRTPVVTFALISGILAAAATFVAGVVCGLVFSDRSMIGLVDYQKGAIGSGFAQMLNFSQVGFGDAGRLGPALFVMLPIGSSAIAAVTQARRTLGLPPPARLLAGVAVGVVFGALMLVAVAGAGSLDGLSPDALDAVAMGALWGALGGLLGTYYVVRTALGPGYISGLLSPAVRTTIDILTQALRPLVVLLIVTSLVGTTTWTIETLISAEYRQASSTPLAVIDNAAYAIEHGVGWAELGSLAQFDSSASGVGPGESPIPVSDPSKLDAKPGGRYRLFDYARVLPAYTFVPLVVFLVGGVLVLAFSAGATLARSRPSSGLLSAAAAGSLVGPVWASTMTIVNALVSKAAFGSADGGSVFWSFLLGGILIGAVGGMTDAWTRQRRGLGVGTKAAAGVAAPTNLEGR